MKTWQADLLITFGGSLWGLSFIFARWGLQYCSPALFLFLRFFLAALVVWLIFYKDVNRTPKKIRDRGLILGLLMGAGYLLQIYSINFTDVARASFLTGMCLIFIPFLNFLLFREIVKLHSLIGLILAVIGLYILLDPSFSGLKSGDIMGLAAMPLWALYMIYMSVFTEKEEGLAKTYQFLFWQLAGVLPVALITALIFESGLVKSLHPDLSKAITITPLFLIGLFFNAVLASVVTVLIQTYSQKHTTAIQAMICYQAEPITATLAAAIILGDRLTFNVVAGGLVIILAILISEAGGLLMERRKAA